MSIAFFERNRGRAFHFVKCMADLLNRVPIKAVTALQFYSSVVCFAHLPYDRARFLQVLLNPAGLFSVARTDGGMQCPRVLGHLVPPRFFLLSLRALYSLLYSYP